MMKTHKVVALIIARMTSSRLPGKHLRLINGIPLIQHIIERLANVHSIDQIILASGPKDENQDMAKFVQRFGIETFFDSDVEDVTGRIYRAAEEYEAEVVVTISGDCPLIDPQFIQMGIQTLLLEDVDWATVDKSKHACLHEGIGFHTLNTWKRLNLHSTTWSHKEHAGSVMFEMEGDFKKAALDLEKNFQRDDFRISVDTQSDLDFINRIYKKSGVPRSDLTLQRVVEIIDQNPQLKMVNQHVHQKGLLERSLTMVILTYASKELGLGHLSRMLALARELRESKAVKVLFIINENSFNQAKINDAGFEMITWDNPSLAEIYLNEIITSIPLDGLIIDVKSEDLNGEFKFVNALEVAQTVIDVWPNDHDPDILHIIPSLLCLEGRISPKIKCGAQYIMLNRELLDLKRESKSRSNIVVTGGGSGEIPYPLLKVLSQLAPEFPIKFILGPYSDIKKLEVSLMKANLSNYTLLQDPQNILKEFASSALAFSVFGVSSYELMALGVPQCIYNTLSYIDHEIVNELEQAGACINLENGSMESKMGKISDLLKSKSDLNEMSRKAQQLVDGNGVSRVANIVADHINMSLRM